MLDRNTAPQIIMPKKLNLLHAETIALSNGLQLKVLKGCSQPIINLSVLSLAGKYYENKPSVASITALLLKKGTKNYSANAIEENLDFLGASVNPYANMFTSGISLSCMSKNLEKSLPFLNEIIENSVFPQEEIDLEKEVALQNLKIQQGQVNYLSSVELMAQIYGKNHPCGKASNAQDIKAITRQDIEQHYQKHIQPHQGDYVVLSGDISSATLRLVIQSLEKLNVKSTARSQDFIPLKPSTSQQEIFNIPKENSVQSSIKIGAPIPLSLHSKDFLDFEILNRVLGGYFGSRLMKNIREEKGYTYGIYSSISRTNSGNFFTIATDVGTQYKEATFNEISKEINRLKEELISEEELNMVKNYHKGSIMNSIDGSLKMASRIISFLPLGLHEEFINERLMAVENISAERLQSLAKQYLDFDKMYKIVAG